MLPGKWTLASQGSTWELAEWRCSGGEGSWSPKGLAAQLEDHTCTHIHTGTLHTPHACACHRQTTYKHTPRITCVYTQHTHTPMYTYAHTHASCMRPRHISQTCTCMAHIPTTGSHRYIYVYHTNLYVPCGPHITHMFIFHMLQTHAHTTLHIAHTCMAYTTPMYIHICHTHIHTSTPLSSRMFTALIPHIHTNGPRSYPQHTHLCSFPQFHTYYIHVDIHTTSILIIYTHTYTSWGVPGGSVAKNPPAKL